MSVRVGMHVLLVLAVVLASSCAGYTTSAPIVFDVLPSDDVKIETRTGGIRMSDVLSDAEVVFATNGGIFERPETPTGLLISGGKEQNSTNLGEGSGNFFLKPNGVLFRTDNGQWKILEAQEFESHRPLVEKNVTDATQSGPMLLRHGTIHHSIRESSENKLLRSAACVDPKGGLHLIMSRVGITFHALATISIEKSCTDALYLDGVISSVLVSGNVLPSENKNRRYASMIVVRRR